MQVLEELDATFEAVDLDTTRCLILTGAGEKSFVAGADIGEMSTLTKAEGEAFGKKGNDVFRAIETFPIPVIAAVNGFALGGGCEISMSCDIRICSENAIFGQPEAGLGITPGFGGTQRLARLVGAGMAKQLIYTARNIKADEAYRIGLVNAVYPLGRASSGSEEDGSRHRSKCSDRCQKLQEGYQRWLTGRYGYRQLLSKRSSSVTASRQRTRRLAWATSLRKTRRRNLRLFLSRISNN